MIELKNVSKVFRGPNGDDVVAVERVSLRVEAGETVALLGTSGCGKTTTMKMINRLIEPSAGEIYVGGEEIRSLDPIRLRRRIGYVIQTGGLFPHMTVRENIELLPRLEKKPSTTRRARTDELLSLVNLPADTFADRHPSELSGGQRQRVGVARALTLDPEYILMDEPFGALDPITRDQIHQEFIELKKRVQKTIIMVTHDTAEAFKLADRIAIMDAGAVRQIGTEAELRGRPSDAFITDFLHGHSRDLSGMR